MLWRLLLLFTVLPFVELTLLLWLSDQTDWKVAVAVILVTGLLGASLARRQGLRVWQRLHDDLREGRVPTDTLQDGLLVLISATLLVSPGLLTDAAGLLLLLPPARRVAKAWMRRRFQVRLAMRANRRPDSGPAHDEENIIDVSSRPVEPPGDA